MRCERLCAQVITAPSDKDCPTGQLERIPETGENPQWRRAVGRIVNAALRCGETDRRTLLCKRKVHYNPLVRPHPCRGRTAPAGTLSKLGLLVFVGLWGGVCPGQQVPAASGARILLLPRRLVIGERATLAVLDVNGRLTPGVNVAFSYGEKVTTDTTGRARFVAPLNPGTISAGIEGRSGKVSATIVTPAEISSATEEVTAAPRLATLGDRFELVGYGFCGDADANHVKIGELQALVLASSPGSLIVLPPAEAEPGPMKVQASCGQKAATPFTMVFVNLELEASSGTLSPGEHRTLSVRVKGTTAKVAVEARNLGADVAELVGGGIVRASSSGGAENIAKFELAGRTRGNFTISIRLVAPLTAPRL